MFNKKLALRLALLDVALLAIAALMYHNCL